MGEYVAEGNLGAIPDDLTLPQFILDLTHPTRPIRKEGIPWLIDDTTGRKIGFEEVSREIPDDEFVASGSVRLGLLKIAGRCALDPEPRLWTRKCVEYQTEYS